MASRANLRAESVPIEASESLLGLGLRIHGPIRRCVPIQPVSRAPVAGFAAHAIARQWHRGECARLIKPDRRVASETTDILMRGGDPTRPASERLRNRD
jgi:hypothetical protein